MVSAEEQRREKQVQKPIQFVRGFFLLSHTPLKSLQMITKSSCYSFLIWKVFRLESLEIAMDTTRGIDHARSPSSYYCIISCSTWMPPRR